MLKDDLIELISYLVSTKKSSQKMAREIEKFLREGIPITPNPDPQKEVFRIIKQALEYPIIRAANVLLLLEHIHQSHQAR